MFLNMKSWAFGILFFTYLHCGFSIQLVTENGQFNTHYTRSIDTTEQRAFLYDTSEIEAERPAQLRLEVEIENSVDTRECPLLVAAQYGKEVAYWALPQISQTDNGGNFTYNSGGRTLCIEQPASLRGIVVGFSTCGAVQFNYSMQLSLTYDFVKDIDEEVEISVSPTTPYYYRFNFPEGIDVVLVKVTSSEDHCMILSMQKPQCPIFDLESNIQYSGYWQTVTYRAGVTIERNDFPDGVILVFSVATKNEGCRNKDGYNADSDTRLLIDNPRTKPVKFVIERGLHQNEYVWPTFFPLVSYLPFLVATIIVFFVSHIYLHRNLYENSYDSTDSKCPIHSAKLMRKTIDEVDNYKIDKVQQKSAKFMYGMIVIAVFYCLPVFQLIVSYLQIVYRTGEHDVCYYNNLCSLPLGKIMDFNHIYSNIGYVILGPVFMIFVRLRQRSIVTKDYDKKPVCFFLKKIESDVEHGTYQHYGVYYSLGFALFMEGFLSAGYHICPNKSNFQFDTSFMYAMAVLSYIKVYQFRHPLHITETLIFISLAIVVTCVVFGLLTSSLAFRIIISLVHLICVVGVQLFLAYDARTRYDKQESVGSALVTICKELVSMKEPTYLSRYHPNKTLFWWTVLANAILISLTWTILYGNNFATQVLYVLLFNLAIYVLYYGVMKTVHHEWRASASIQPIIYGILALVFWVPGLYLFMNPLSGWEDSPSESRNNNEECLWVKFYDNHDVWHFLSAGGLFYSFMLFLTMDDIHIRTHQTKIPMF